MPTHPQPRPWLRRASVSMIGFLLSVAIGCGDERGSITPVRPSNLVVRERIAALAPSANLAHRGTGTNTNNNPYAENSLTSFARAIDEGADGVELDVELTSDGQLVIMHDDTLDRTTDCQGCVSAFTFAEVRECRLRDGAGNLTDEPPPTLAETFEILPDEALVNIELKVYDADCLTDTTGPVALAEAAVVEVRRLRVGDRSLFSSFSAEAAAAVKASDSELYSALLVSGLRTRNVDQAAQLQLDAIHPGGVFPFVQVPAAVIQDALSRGLQVNVWTVDDLASIEAMIDAGATSIITNEPEIVAAEVDSRR